MADQTYYHVRSSDSHARSIGITQRATPLDLPWTGELRVRFSDFQVNEIGPDGSVVRLRTLGVNDEREQRRILNPNNGSDKPKKEVKPELNAEDGETAPEKTIKGKDEIKEKPAEIADEDVKILENLGGENFAKDLVELFQNGEGEESEKKKRVTSIPVEDKVKRGQIHQEIRRIFNSRVDTNTDGDGAIVACLVSTKRGKKRTRGGGRERKEEKPTGEYLHFTLFKDNRDTMDAVNQIARMLRVKPQVIGYAGTKDRRASTSQRCSVRYMRPKALAGINGKVWGVATGDYEYKDEPIYLGQLNGNEFTITIKDCRIFGEPADIPIDERLSKLRSTVQPALDRMAEHGWINYFGHQRFGTHHIGTHVIGKLILGEKFEEAIESLLYYDSDIAARAEAGEVGEDASKRDELSRNHACMLFRTGQDADKAIKIMPRRFSAETSIFRHLSRQGSSSERDFVGAIIHITRGLRSMYLHAYQSHVWNNAASRRWSLHGSKVVKGDLVIAENEVAPAAVEQDEDGDDIINPVEGDDTAPVRARPLTAEEASSGQYTIFDVVLPTPGYDVTYPDNEIGRFYEEFMGREENGGMDPHKMRRVHREFSQPGRYRKLMNRFLNKPSIEFKAYADDTDQMHPTDLDLIRQAREATGQRDENGSEDEPVNKKAKIDDDQSTAVADAGDKEMTDADIPAEQGEQVNDGQEATVKAEANRVAAVVRFQLGSSAYATVTLRELMGDPPEGVEAGSSASNEVSV